MFAALFIHFSLRWLKSHRNISALPKVYPRVMFHFRQLCIVKIPCACRLQRIGSVIINNHIFRCAVLNNIINIFHFYFVTAYVKQITIFTCLWGAVHCRIPVIFYAVKRKRGRSKPILPYVVLPFVKSFLASLVGLEAAAEWPHYTTQYNRIVP